MNRLIYLHHVQAKKTNFDKLNEEETVMKGKMKALLAGIAMGTMLLGAGAVHAAEFTTVDGVLSIETPSNLWVQTVDPKHWFVISDGKNSITIDHLSNGEKLPEVEVANDDNAAVFQAFVSTKNEVFVVKGLAASMEDLGILMDTTGTIKVLKFDTKTAIQTANAPVRASEFGLRAINAEYYVTTDELNVRNGCSTDEAKIGTLTYGQKVMVNGAVTKNGADYGWYQIQYNGGVAYVSAGFLSAAAPTGNNASSNTSSTDKYPVADGFPAYDANGKLQGNLVLYSDGYYYSNDMMRYTDNGDGSYSGAGEVLYAYFRIENGTAGTAGGSSQNGSDKYPLASGFPIYDINANRQGNMVPYSDGYYYSNDMVRYTDNGDGSYTSAYDTLYEYDAIPWNTVTNDEDNDDYSDEGYTDDVYGLASEGSGRPATVHFEGGGYFDENGTEYYNQNDGTFIDENGDVFDVQW